MTKPNKAKEAQLTQERLKEQLHYDPETGAFTWRISKGRKRAGAPAGSWQQGRLKIYIGGANFFAHRLAFLYMNGHWPEELVDHRDGDPTNNRWKNLREATNAQNLMNRRAFRNKKIDLKGVMPVGKRYKATIKYPGDTKTTHLGYYDTPEEAYEAYRKVAEALQGEFFRAA